MSSHFVTAGWLALKRYQAHFLYTIKKIHEYTQKSHPFFIFVRSCKTATKLNIKGAIKSFSSQYNALSINHFQGHSIFTSKSFHK